MSNKIMSLVDFPLKTYADSLLRRICFLQAIPSAEVSLYRRFSPPNSLHPRFSPPEFVPVNSLFVLFIYLFSAYFSFRRLKSPSAFLSANFSLCQLFLSADFCLRRLFSLQTFLSTQFLSSEVCVPEYIKEIQLFLINI